MIPNIHDYRVIFTEEKNPTPEEAAHLEWRACDADGACAALLEVSVGGADVSVTLSALGARGAVWPPSGWRLYGDAGTLVADGFDAYAVYRPREGGGSVAPGFMHSTCQTARKRMSMTIGGSTLAAKARAAGSARPSSRGRRRAAS